MKLVDFSIRRRVTVAMLMVAVIAFGAVGFTRLSVDLLPDITYPTITVRTEYLGVAPMEIERLISEPIEGLVGVVDSVVRVSSISRPGLSDVVVEFAWGTNMDFAALDIREKLDLVELPREADKPILLRFDPSLDPIMRVALFGGVSLMELRRLADQRIRLELESLPGVAAVRVEGGLEEEIHVEVQTARLASLGIPIGQVAGRLAAENVNLTGGLLKDGEAEYLVRTLNEFQDPAEIGDIVIARMGESALKLNAVGRVFRSHKERDVITRINGREGVEIALFKEGDSNTVMVSRAIREKLEAFLDEYGDLLGESDIAIVFDQAVFIEQAVEEVLYTAILGGILAVLVLYLFLENLKSTVIISLSIPISVVATFFLMFVTDVSLNIMSLGGLALGVGMLVDNSIVVLENVQRYRDRGVSAVEASRRGSSEVGQAVVAATLTTICVFLPIVFVEGVGGQLFRDQALTVTFSLVASLVVALMLIPMLSALTLRPLSGEEDKGRSGGDGALVRGPAAILQAVMLLASVLRWLCRVVFSPVVWVFQVSYRFLDAAYPKVLGWSLGNRMAVLGVFLVLSLVVLYRARSLGLELIPEMSQREFLLDLEWPAGTPLDATARHVAAIDTGIRSVPGVETVFSKVGASGESGGYAEEKKENRVHVYVRVNAELPREEETRIMETIRKELSTVPAVDVKFSRPSYFSFRTPVEVEITGYNLEALRFLADTVKERMIAIPGLADIKSSAEGGQPEIQVVFDRERVAELGTSIEEIGRLLRNKIQGDVATEFNRRDRQIDIRVRAIEDERSELGDLKRLTVSPPAHAVPVSLEAVATVEIEEGPAEIRRLNQERVAVVSANLAGRDLGAVVRDIEEAVGGIPLLEGFAIAVGGQNEEMVRSFESMKFALTLAVFLVYLVMASQFESLLHPLVIMVTIPFGMVGSALALLVAGQSISVVVLIGLIMLAGIVVNNAIVLVDYINRLRRSEGMSKQDAVMRAGRLRFRPILMTSMTTILALLPMALGFGEGAEIRAPMAITVIGGLLVSSLLTLIVIPVVYTLVERNA